ncbi:MAG: bifunctional UDP-N-acetylglucosamine pyrophosphorylase / glucosamine-phosphate N-acetyltransferase [Candidatus Eremiobacteraeota bacterium]|jgi:bifunctional UDP-N-acetylglucosamine pyrophosphorylase/glucosamine-1-phosphate N-acetyltransferase|nr:bifunctional UDP-N-acetylglucosamine pyrophosphorylase / glucosamine-phosphate N-acetyltransferase [Candidatus Eremiobacteraeota bacterium]
MNARAVVLAAGKGTRMKSARPKVLHELCGRPMLWWVLEALNAAGVDDVIVVTNPELDPLLAPLGVRTVIQDEQLGTGHAVKIALEALEPRDGSVIVAYGDMPLVDRTIFADVQAALDFDAATALALVTARMPLPSSFGRIVRASILPSFRSATATADESSTEPALDAGSVERIVEAKDCTPAQLAIDEMNAGIYAFGEAALRAIVPRIGNDNAQREYYLTDAVELLIAAGRRVVPVPVADYRSVLGVNDRVELASAGAILNRRLCEEHMRAGVTIQDPATTYLEPGVLIGRDTVIEHGTQLSGATAIGAGCTIGPNCRIANARIGDDVRITESVVLDSAVGAGTRIGPYAHLRGGASLGANVRIGNFVEIKKSDLADDVKANHLAYIGDATVGERTNYGAGAITCNYDGKRKNRTQIGSDVFIGTNNSLVAPLSIGDGAMTGASAVVIRDVPAGDKQVGNPARSIAKKPAQT